MSLREKAKSFSVNLPFMDGREKAELENIYGRNLTIVDYGFLQDEKKKEYVCFIVKEDSSNFYFGGQVLTENLKEFEADGYRDEIQKDGLPVYLERKKTKDGKREYTKVTYYPE